MKQSFKRQLRNNKPPKAIIQEVVDGEDDSVDDLVYCQKAYPNKQSVVNGKLREKFICQELKPVGLLREVKDG